MRKPFIKAILVVLFAPLLGVLPAELTKAYCWGADKDADPPVITLDVQNEPLGSVLEKISKTTRWKIEGPDGWMAKPVTQALNKATLDEALRSVLRGAGIEDLMVLYDENVKAATLFDIEGEQKQAAGRPPAQANAQQQYVSPAAPNDPMLERARRSARVGSARRAVRGRLHSNEDEP